MGLLFVGAVWLIGVLWLWRRADHGRTAAVSARDLLAGGLLCLLVAGFFWRTLSGEVFQPADGGDLVSFLFPTYRFAARQLSQGVLPLWNPHLYGGAPFISDIQAGWLYPPNLLLFLLNPNFDYSVLQWLAAGHLAWAALGMYVLLRTLRRTPEQPFSRPAACFGALAFALSDPLIIHFGNLNLIAVLSWLPWTLAAYSRALAERNLCWAVGAGLLFALGNYAGHAQSSLYIGLALGVFTVIALSEEWGRRKQFPLSSLQPLLLTWLIALLLTAPILLPAIELTQYAARRDFVYQDTVNFSLAPTQALIGLVTPGFFGHGPALHWSLWQRVETPFAGVATLILAAAGLILTPANQRRRLWPWVGLALFGLITALGVYALFHGWLTQLLPGFDQLRAPARALSLWTLALAVLAAAGLDALSFPGAPAHLEQPPRPTSLTPLLTYGALFLGLLTALLYIALLLTQADPTAFLRTSVAALALTLALGCWLATWAVITARRSTALSSGAGALLLIGVLYFDLSAAGAYTDISPEAPTRGYDQPEIVAFLQADPDRFRIDSDTDIAGLWQPDAAALYGLEDVAGIANPLTLRHWMELLMVTGGRQSRLYDLLNVKYVLVRDGTPLPTDKFVLAFDAPRELSIYRNQAFLPRAWLAHTASVQPDAAATLAALRDPAFDPTATVLLSINPNQLGPVAPARGAESITVTKYGPNALTLQVQASAPGYLVLSEVWYPGWQATVNGVATPVLRANYALRAVAVPAGATTVELWFAPRTWQWGLAAAGVGVLVVGLILLRSQRRMRAAPPESPRT